MREESSTSTISGNSEPLKPSDIASLFRTFVISVAALYFELLIIRYVGTEIRIFAYLKNVTVLAAFCGMGIGMVNVDIPERLKRWVPLPFVLLFLSLRFSQAVGLMHVGISSSDELVWRAQMQLRPWGAAAVFFPMLALLFLLMMAFFIFIGSLVGQELKHCKQLPGYSANLAGSLGGMLLFTITSFYNTAPVVWIALGCLLLAPFVYRQRLLIAAMLAVVLFTAIPEQGVFWSPYYRIDFHVVSPPPGLSKPAAYSLDVNHDYHQRALDLSGDFMRRYPDYFPNREALASYDLPY
jgi:hypothetical protein